MRPSRLVRRCLAWLLPRAEADALLGDLREEAVRCAPARPGPWLEWRAWRYVVTLAPGAVRMEGRTSWHVVRDATRSLRASPAATAGILAILTVGIAAATVTFSVVDTVVLRPLPFEADGDLAVVELRDDSASRFPSRSLAPQQYLALVEHFDSFDALAAVARTGVGALNVDGTVERLEGARVTASLFEVLRMRPFIGRTFTAADEVAGSDQVAVIGYDLWQRRFGGDPGIVGRTISVMTAALPSGASTDASLTVLGVMPRGFAYPVASPSPSEIWTPYVMTPDERASGGAGGARSRYLHVVGRLRAGTSMARAQAEAVAATAALREVDAEFYRSSAFHILSLKDTLVGDVRGWMLLVLGAVAVVMLIACVNVANLQLARATSRARELSIRASLGATRRQLVASLLVESLLLSLTAAALAIVIALWGIQVAKAGLPADLARVAEIRLDLRVLAAAISAAVATGLLFGVVPAWQASRGNLVGLMTSGTRSVIGGRQRWRAAFVIAEVAFVSVLLVGATLVISSFIRVTTADLGFDRSHLLFVSGDDGVGADGTAAALARLQSLPGVAAAGALNLGSPPLAGAGFREGGATAMAVSAPDAPPGAAPHIAEVRNVSSGYFAAAGIPVVSGRVFDVGRPDSDDIILDDHVAAAIFGPRQAVGAEVIVSGGRKTVVAVVRHVQLAGPERSAMPQMYFPMRMDRGGFNFLIRISAPPDAVVPAIRAAFPRAVTTGEGALEVRLIEDAFRNITADRRFNAGLMSIFGVLAILMGAAGIHGVMSSVVAQQTREMGVRVALGATTGRIVGDVLAQAGRYLAVGLAIGLVAAWWLSQGLASILFDVQPTDVAVYATVAAVMTAAGVVAAWLPARRAARVDPLVALRSE